VIARFAADPLFQATLHGVASLLFLSAALHKLRGPAEFRAALGGYGLLPTAALGIAGTGLAALELALGVALLIPATGGVAGAVGAALMLLYAAGMAWNLRRGRAHIDCGWAAPAAADRSSYEAQRRYDASYIQCMYAKGHQVPVSGRYSQPTQSAPYYPPPPPGSAPPPRY